MGLGTLRDGLAPTPPMGWNSWNRFAGDIDERVIRESAEAIVTSGMRDAGYRYVVVDDGWQAERRDDAGGLRWNAERFPSGIAALAEHVHALELKFGLYTDAGDRSCLGLPGSRGHEREDARQFAAWGVDYLKVDWCHTEGLDPRAAYGLWSEALRESGRPIVFSICEWGRSRPWEWARGVGHLWRTGPDIKDTWMSVLATLDRQAELHLYAGPDGWNDPDMLEVGNGSMTVNEWRAHFALWAMLAAPLMAGNDVRDMPENVRAILRAPEVIAVDQDPAGRQGRRVRADGDVELWVKELADPAARAILVLNRGEALRRSWVSWDELGWPAAPPPPAAAVRDLWARRDLGTFERGYGCEVEPHSATLLRASVGAPPE